ncbi:hypothetical protein [Tessaracoccus massiliensis]|nr:hypothetical protein [Tessaracoccus massiliensis]
MLIDPEGGTVVGERDVSPELDVETSERVTASWSTRCLLMC